jgi:hypothetical protein
MSTAFYSVKHFGGNMSRPIAKPHSKNFFLGVRLSPDIYKSLIERQEQLSKRQDRTVTLSEIVRKVLRVEFRKQSKELPAK